MNEQQIQKLEKNLKKLLIQSVKPNATVILGLSGGSDSVFLLHLLKELPIKTICAHLNHKLRGEESDNDEDFCKSICLLNKIPFESLSKNIQKISKEKKLGIEETGRRERYGFFKKLCKKHSASHVLTAHHLNDNVETFIFNLIRGATIKGLSGIKETEKFSEKTFLFRPLLNVSKKEIVSYLKAKKIRFLKEKSNKDTSFDRNFIRLKIFPLMEKLNPRVLEHVGNTIKNIKETKTYLLKETERNISLIALNEEKTKLCAKKFKKTPEVVQKNILFTLHERIIGNSMDIKTINSDEVLNIINKNVGNKKKKFGKLAISVNHNIIYLEKMSRKGMF